MSKLSGKVCLITGGAGFVGNALAHHLVSIGCEVYCLDDYSTSKTHPTWNQFEVCHSILQLTLGGIHYIHGHTCDISHLCSGFSPDIVFHFGEYSRIHQSWSECEKVWKSNLFGTTCVFEYCVKRNIPIVYSASSAILGETVQRTPYTFSKRVMVDLLKRYHEWFGLQYIITYFYNVYGEGQISDGPYATVLGIFERQHFTGQKLTVVEPGTQSRCFTHITDIISGICTAVEKFSNVDVPIRSKDELSIIELAQLFTSSEKEIEYLPQRKGDRVCSTVELPDLLRDNGWESTVNLREYIDTKLN